MGNPHGKVEKELNCFLPVEIGGNFVARLDLPFDDVGWCRCVQTPPGSVDEAEVGDEIRFRALLPCHDVKKLTEIIVYAK